MDVNRRAGHLGLGIGHENNPHPIGKLHCTEVTFIERGLDDRIVVQLRVGNLCLRQQRHLRASQCGAKQQRAEREKHCDDSTRQLPIMNVWFFYLDR